MTGSSMQGEVLEIHCSIVRKTPGPGEQQLLHTVQVSSQSISEDF